MKSEKGFLLLELLVALAVMAILVGMSVGVLHQAIVINTQKAANDRVAGMWQTIGSDATCHVLYGDGSTRCAAIDAMMPSLAPVASGRFLYSYSATGGGWTYTATPSSTADGLRTVWITNEGGLQGGQVNSH